MWINYMDMQTVWNNCSMQKKMVDKVEQSHFVEYNVKRNLMGKGIDLLRSREKNSFTPTMGKNEELKFV